MDWPHAPVHRFGESGIYFVTGATLYKQHFYRSPSALDALQALLFTLAARYYCALQAWALFSNHYHLVIACDRGEDIHRMLSLFHSDAAVALNRTDGVSGRKVWFQFRETLLTYERSWLARLRYTHENAVHHKLVPDAAQYPWCSARWFQETARKSFVDTVRNFPVDRINVYDNFVAALPPD